MLLFLVCLPAQAKVIIEPVRMQQSSSEHHNENVGGIKDKKIKMINSIQDGSFRGRLRMGCVGQKAPISLKSVTHILQLSSSAQSYFI